MAGALGALVVSGVWACANQGAPPGGPEDRRPPVVVRTEPEAFAVVRDLGREVRFHFDERISERSASGTLDDAITVSPRGGEVRVSHDSRSLSVRVEGGFRPGVVYRVTLLPVVRDLFGNQLGDPFELVFSTGGEPTPTALAGQVWDRTSGQGVREALVQAVGEDSLVHVARADEEGIYAFRYLPSGSFVVTGFEDVDRDGEVGAREVKGSLPARLAPGDTVLLDVPVLAPDTTPAVLTGASALDSVTLVLQFDDYLDSSVELDGVRVDLMRADGEASEVSRLFHEPEYADFVRAALDSLAALEPPEVASPPDTITAVPAADGADTVSVAPPGDSAVVPDTTPRPAVDARGRRAAPTAAPGRLGGPPALPGARGSGPPSPSGGRGRASALPPGRVLPGRRLVGRLEAPLDVGVEYQVTVSSVVNLNGLDGGGGEATLLLEAPTIAEPPGPGDSITAADSTLVPDTAGAPPPPDTLGPRDPNGGRP